MISHALQYAHTNEKSSGYGLPVGHSSAKIYMLPLPGRTSIAIDRNRPKASPLAGRKDSRELGPGSDVGEAMADEAVAALTTIFAQTLSPQPVCVRLAARLK